MTFSTDRNDWHTCVQVITSSLDRTVKVWNINNIFEQVHVIDRHEMQVDSISLCQAAGLAVTVTRGAVGVWDMQIGRLIARLADSPLGAIVTHASITADSKLVARTSLDPMFSRHSKELCL
jgi:WD40 repeat protein